MPSSRATGSISLFSSASCSCTPGAVSTRFEAYRSALDSSGPEQDRRRALIGCAAANRLLARIVPATSFCEYLLIMLFLGETCVRS